MPTDPTNDASGPDPVGPPVPTQAEIATLPRWAQVAFAARCARRVQPLVKAFWPDIPEHHERAVDDAIRASARSAHLWTLADAIAQSSAEVRAVWFDEDQRQGHGPAHSAVRMAVRAAMSSARAAAIGAGYANENADDRWSVGERPGVTQVAETLYGVVTSARDASRAAQRSSWVTDVREAIRHDFDLVAAFAKAELAKGIKPDELRVPPSVFGPMWPNGAPEGWPDYTPQVPTETADIDAPPPADDDLPAAPLSLYFDLDEFTREDINDIIAGLSALYEEVSDGDELIIDTQPCTLELAVQPAGAA